MGKIKRDSHTIKYILAHLTTITATITRRNKSENTEKIFLQVLTGINLQVYIQMYIYKWSAN